MYYKRYFGTIQKSAGLPSWVKWTHHSEGKTHCEVSAPSILSLHIIGTMAMIMNCIPHVINARPGLKTMVDIPVPHAIMGDMRDMIDEDCKLVK